MHQVRQETAFLRDEQGQPIQKLLKMEGENMASTSHHSIATSPQSNDGQSVICKICNQLYQDPRLLDCLHSFCLRCLEKTEVYKNSSGSRRILRCPECYQDTDVPLMGVSGLCIDFITTMLVEEQSIKQQLLPQGPQILCQACNEKQPAVVRCLDCIEFLCNDCKMAHQRFIKMKSHKLVTLEDLRSGKVTLKRKYSIVRKCRNHLQQDLSMFCITCQEMICLMCTTLNHCKPDHAFVYLKTAEALCRSEILNVITPLEVHIKEHQVAKTSAEQAKKSMETNVREMLGKIDKKTSLEVNKLTRKANILKDKAEYVGKERGKMLDKWLTVANRNVTETEFILKRVRSIVTDGDCHDIINLKEQILKNVKRVSLKKAESFPLNRFLMDFAESSTSGSNLGELIPEEEWTLKEDFGKNSIPAFNFERAIAVVARSNGDMIVLDSLTKRVMTITSKGVHKGTINSKDPRGILIKPIGIALSTSENILVLDSAVKVFHKEGIFIKRLALPEGFTSANCIDAGSGKIAIGTKEKILLLNEDGSNATFIPAKLIYNHIAICSKTQSLIYINYDWSRLVSVKFSGRENFNIATNKSVKPTGICTDTDGDIYIAVHTGVERGTGEIHHYSPEGSYIGLVARNLYNPIGLSFSPTGELMVADRHSVKVFKRV